MIAEILKTVGLVAGIGGIAIGVLLIIFREIIRKNIFPTLTKQQAYRLLLLIVILVWSVAIAGIWVYATRKEPGPSPPDRKEIIYRGYVRDKDTKNIIENASVSMINAPDLAPQKTDSNGLFIFRIITNENSYNGTVLVQHEQYREWSKNLILHPYSEIEEFLLAKKVQNEQESNTTIRPSPQPGKADLAISVTEKRPVEENNIPPKKSELQRQNEPDFFRKKLWKNGSTIQIRFLDGEQTLKDKVADIARQWTQYANLRFDFNGASDAHVRISFRQSGSWSYLGTDCLAAAQEKPTMNFGGLNENSSDEEISRTVLHEFGHAIGLINEIESPKANIPWNRAAVYNYFISQLRWTKEAVDNRFFNRSPSFAYRDFDPQSIMADPVSRELTTNGFEIGFNTKLSNSDKAWIAELYPR